VDHDDHVALLRAGVTGRGGTWADIGAGRGAFTLALADLLGPGSRIVAVDRDARALEDAVRAVSARFPEVTIEPLVADLREPIDLPELDGLVAANSLHFLRRPERLAAVRRLAGRVRDGGRFIVVEYDTDAGNPWVPHPFSFETWVADAPIVGLEPPDLLGRVPSRHLRAIYSAVTAVDREASRP
jgi:SAM-dependent methyltransferase